MSVFGIFNLSTYTPEQKEQLSPPLLLVGVLGLLATAYTARNFRTRPLRAIVLGGLSSASLLAGYRLRKAKTTQVGSNPVPVKISLERLSGPLPDEIPLEESSDPVPDKTPLKESPDPVPVKIPLEESSDPVDGRDPLKLPRDLVGHVFSYLSRHTWDVARGVAPHWRNTLDSLPPPPFAFATERDFDKTPESQLLQRYANNWAIPIARWRMLERVRLFPSEWSVRRVAHFVVGQREIAASLTPDHPSYPVAAGAIFSLDKTDARFLRRESDLRGGLLPDIVRISAPLPGGKVCGVLQDRSIVVWDQLGRPEAELADLDFDWERLRYDPQTDYFICSKASGGISAVALNPFRQVPLSQQTKVFYHDADTSRVFCPSDDNREIQIWNLQDDSPALMMTLPGPFSEPIDSLLYEEGVSLLLASAGNTIYAWEITPKGYVPFSFKLRRSTGFDNPIICHHLAFDPVTSLVIVHATWRHKKGKALQMYTFPAGYPIHMSDIHPEHSHMIWQPETRSIYTLGKKGDSLHVRRTDLFPYSKR